MGEHVRPVTSDSTLWARVVTHRWELGNVSMVGVGHLGAAGSSQFVYRGGVETAFESGVGS